MTDNNQLEFQEDEPLMRCITGYKLGRAELERISERTSGEAQGQALDAVSKILKEVRKNGDKALIKFTKQFDGFLPEPLEISNEVLVQAWNNTPRSLQNALKLAKNRIRTFHELELPKNLSSKGIYGEQVGRRWGPVQKAGIYIPGGRAAYPSTVLMNAIPALVAGVQEVVMVTPATNNGEINPTVLAAAHLVGIHRLFRIGGAQAIAALAYGTESVPSVDVISGPGNLYVTLAKKSLYGEVGIDSLAGPSEVLIIADKSAQVEQLASDLLAQAEHDPLAAAILLTTESQFADTLPREIERQLKNHPREKICRKSLKDWGLIVICKDIKSCIELNDQFAPEHLELLIDNPNSILHLIKNAGAIFVGPWSPEAVGDYLAGPNHTLPTSGTARFSGALGVETFMKNTSIIQFNQSAFEATSKEVIELANSEGLHSHAESIKIRTNQ